MISKEKKNLFFYRNTIGHIERNRVLVVGAGPVGLRLVFFILEFTIHNSNLFLEKLITGLSVQKAFKKRYSFSKCRTQFLYLKIVFILHFIPIKTMKILFHLI